MLVSTGLDEEAKTYLDGEKWGTSGNNCLRSSLLEPTRALCIIQLSICGHQIRRMGMKAFKRDAAMTAATDASWLRQIIGIARRLGPYAAIEIVLPGGSLVVLLLWLFRRHRDMRSFGWMMRMRSFAAIARLRLWIEPERANC